jgi:hypothetical protein
MGLEMGGSLAALALALISPRVANIAGSWQSIIVASVAMRFTEDLVWLGFLPNQAC